MNNNILAPSILACDVACMGKQINIAVDYGAQYIHIDVMDGVFVPKISYGQCVVESLRGCTNAIFDVHLMIVDPIRYVQDFASIGADIITVHLEACNDVKQTLTKIRECGCKVGLSIKPSTDINELKPYLDLVDMILIMCVEPGLGGQTFIDESYDRISMAKKIVDEFGKRIDIEVDGGIHVGILERVLDAGANVIVSGSSIFHGNIAQNICEFCALMHI